MAIYYEAKALERAIDAAPRITPSTKSVLKKIIRSAPAADAEPVVHGKPVTKIHTDTLTGYHEEIGKFAEDGANLYRKEMVHANIPYYHCPVCGAILCSRWHNYCGKCGAKMDLEAGV